jgi:hypothetical protein
MKKIKIQIDNQIPRTFYSKREVVEFLNIDDNPKPIKTTKKYTVWRSLEDFGKSKNLFSY